MLKEKSLTHLQKPKRPDKPGQAVEEVLHELAVIVGIGLAHYGKLHIKRPLRTLIFTLTFFAAGYYVSTEGYHMLALHWFVPEMIGTSIDTWFYKQTILWHICLIAILQLTVVTLVVGTFMRFQRTKYEKIFFAVGLVNKLGETPILTKKQRLDRQRVKLTFASKSLGKTAFETAKDHLEAAFGQSVEQIQYEKNQKFVSLVLTKQKLAEHVTYLEALKASKLKPYSFYVGKSLEGVIQQDITSLPHMLIAGTTGAGKSTHFKQVLTSLLASSPHLQMYLVDLKQGLEFVDFRDASNVKVVKSMAEAVAILSKLKTQMQQRFDFMEKHKLKSIDPKKHKLERIVLAIDECSVLYMKRSKDDPEYQRAMQARRLTDELAKLSRAACMHVILATQKVTKETIDTSIQENISARMCFKMNTLQGSLMVLGNKDACELSDTKGRAIWSLGNDQAVVQAPFITDADIVSQCRIVAEEFEQGSRKLCHPMITLPTQKKNRPDILVETENRQDPSTNEATEVTHGIS